MSGERLRVAAITLDFGNTLVRVERLGMRAIVESTAAALAGRGIVADRAGFADAWVEERDRQFREDIPAFREPDIGLRAARTLARLRGAPAPPPDERWDDAAAAALVADGEVDAVVDAYGAEFVARMAPVADATDTIASLHGRGFALAILSNWPLARTIDRFAEAHGWLPYLRGIVVSQRVGWIKPHDAIFEAARETLGRPDGSEILHVGDDWAADVIGASRAGWRTAYLRGRQVDTPLPTSRPGDGTGPDAGVAADLEIDELAELPALVELAGT